MQDPTIGCCMMEGTHSPRVPAIPVSAITIVTAVTADTTQKDKYKVQGNYVQFHSRMKLRLDISLSSGFMLVVITYFGNS